MKFKVKREISQREIMAKHLRDPVIQALKFLFILLFI